jgi:hypothetical protein
MYKKIIFLTILLISIFCVTSTAFAMTQTERQALIAQIQQQIADLWVQVNQILAKQATSTGNCTPNWQCNSWQACVNGQQERYCFSTNGCGDASTRPAESQTCTPCVSSWSCTDWSSCQFDASFNQYIKKRTCVDKNNCLVPTDQPGLYDYTCTGSASLTPPVVVNTNCQQKNVVIPADKAVNCCSGLTYTGINPTILYGKKTYLTGMCLDLSQPAVCGDGFCYPSETIQSCPRDCEGSPILYLIGGSTNTCSQYCQGKGGNCHGVSDCSNSTTILNYPAPDCSLSSTVAHYCCCSIQNIQY